MAAVSGSVCAQSDVRVVSVSEAQWAGENDATNSDCAEYVAMAASTSESAGPRISDYVHLEQSPDLYENLFQAASSNMPAAQDSNQSIAPLEPSYDITPIVVPTERLAANPPAAPIRTAQAAAPPLPAPVTTTPTEAIVVPENAHVSAQLSPGPEEAQIRSHGAGDFLFGCPYYPCQSGTRTICGVDCGHCKAPCSATWEDSHPIPWSLFGPGEYVGPPRTEHVSTYYLRVNDLLTLTYIVSRKKTPEHYRIGVGDRLRIESKSDETLDREVQVQPDGVINLPLIGDVDAAGRTLKDFRDDLMERYGRIEQRPLITVTPLDVNNGLQEILKAVTSQARSAGQAIDLRVTPEGTIQAPGIGSVYVQGLTIEEVRSELEARYAATFGPGLLVSPSLTERARSFVFVGGEVRSPNRYELEGPTTVMQAIQLAGGFNIGANVREVVVFRRDENWCLKATKINVHRPLYGKDPCPVNDVWLRDNDLIIVPKQRILCADDVINLYFTRGIYAVFPISFVYDFSKGSTVIP
jgi:polysaccharide export outer membrane protein